MRKIAAARAINLRTKPGARINPRAVVYVTVAVPLSDIRELFETAGIKVTYAQAAKLLQTPAFLQAFSPDLLYGWKEYNAENEATEIIDGLMGDVNAPADENVWTLAGINPPKEWTSL